MVVSDTAIRWIGISLRTLHLIGVAGVGGALLFEVPYIAWKPYLVLLIASGAGMLLLDIWSNAQCLIQVRGIAVLIKIFFLALSFYVGFEEFMLITVIVISGVISHAPSKVRYLPLIKAFEKG